MSDIEYSWINNATNTRTDGFIDIGVKIFESEDLTDEILKIFLSLLSNGWVGEYLKKDEYGLDAMSSIGNLYLQGLWLPCAPRVALLGQIDRLNDGLPNYGAIPVLTDGKRPLFLTAKLLDRRPNGWTSPAPNASFYHVSRFSPYQATGDREAKRRLGTSIDLTRVTNDVVAVSGDKIIPCLLHGQPWRAKFNAFLVACASAVLGCVADFDSLWNVETSEDIIDKNMKTPLRLGVSEDQIKSLFYARQAPKTEAGRKRPILHWVASHKRRMASGIDIDIRRYLRGITEFEMDGFSFKITSPYRAQDKIAA